MDSDQPPIPGGFHQGSLATGWRPLALYPRFIYLQSWSLRGENRKVTVKTQVGDRSIELEYTPSAISANELDRLVQTLTGALKAKPKRM